MALSGSAEVAPQDWTAVRSGSCSSTTCIAQGRKTGLVQVSRDGNQKYYRANPESPIYSELQGPVIKTVGIVEPLRAAFVFGSVAKGSDKAGSDLAVLVIGHDLEYADVYEALQTAEARLHRRVNPTVMSPAEWRQKRARRDAFAARVASQPKLIVMGSEDGIE